MNKTTRYVPENRSRESGMEKKLTKYVIMLLKIWINCVLMSKNKIEPIQILKRMLHNCP